ncbi:glycosyltransferase [Desulfatitalea alkaliphila]|uniref:Glycosyltransferase n=1 Tax=Desulfatitalea alkaliphila TaxID=2929485 RepID=A0AA41UKX8_9BACT|nr:glycosyltransferase [Desulfatitalea alkaliphila]MCJ8500911.1 glycosyltransferase [Desulfatitalea alkaliphila]
MSVYIRELSRWLGALGHVVDIFTCAGTPRPESPLATNVRLIHLPVDLQAGKAKGGAAAVVPDVFAALERYRQRYQRTYDLIHSHYWLSGMVGAMAQTRWHRPHITMFHTLGAVKNRSCGAENEPARRIAHERWIAATADHIVVPARREMENLLADYHARRETISIVPCGVDPDLFRPMDRDRAHRELAVPADAELVLYVGRFAPLKGLARLLAAVALLRQQHPRLQLMLVGGDGPQSAGHQALTTEVDRLGLQKTVRFMGRVTQQALPLFYNAADLLALPSFYESFGLVVLEALACGTPVVASPVGAAETLVKPGVNGALVRGDQAADLASALDAVLAESRRTKGTADRIRTTVAGYQWSRIADDMAALYTTVAAHHAAGRRTKALLAPCGAISH